MGLLDDAIREHLELRRRHGADPSEVMSKEHEALGPVATLAGGALPAHTDDDARSAAEPSMTAEDRRQEAGRISSDLYLSQETAELDMRAVLDADASMGVGHAARGGMRSMTSAAPVRALH
jgi:hypothetical protein